MGLIKRLWLRAFGASKTTEFSTPPRNAHFSPDGAVQDAGPHLRAWGRHFEENHDVAVGILDELVNQIVGRGIVVEPMVIDPDSGAPLEAMNQALTDLLEEWAETCDVTNQLNWPEVQRLTCRAWVRDGDHFTHHVQGHARGYAFEPGRIPYALELVESDRVPLDYTLDQTSPQVFQGVTLDEWHRPIAYNVYDRQAGGNSLRFSNTATAGFLLKTHPIPAEQMTHLAWRRRYPQVRGVSIFAPATQRLADIHDYDESERITARTVARMGLYLKRDPETYTPPTEPNKERTIEMPQGAVYDELLAGEEIGSVQSDRPNPNLNEFRQGQLRAVAAGTYTRYSAIARDFNGTYSSQRQELVEAAHGYRPLTEFFISRLVRVQYQRLVETALLTGRLDARGIPLRQLVRAEYIGPAIPWIDPAREVEADIKAIAASLVTREQIIRRRGGDPRKVPEREQSEQQTTTQTEPDPLSVGQGGQA